MMRLNPETSAVFQYPCYPYSLYYVGRSNSNWAQSTLDRCTTRTQWQPCELRSGRGSAGLRTTSVHFPHSLHWSQWSHFVVFIATMRKEFTVQSGMFIAGGGATAAVAFVISGQRTTED